MSELQRRIPTALVLILAFASLIIWGSTAHVALTLAFVVILGAWEWASLAGFSAQWQRSLFALFTAGGIGFIWQLDSPQWIHFILIGGLLWWGYALFAIVRFQRHGVLPWSSGIIMLGLGWLTLLPPWLGIIVLHRHPQYGPAWVLCLLGVILIADIGAYFCGRRFGKHALASRISPNKTIEGMLGGLILAGFIGMFGVFLLNGDPFWAVSLIVWLTVLVSILGDLTESVMKRQARVKDSSSLLPGHGGVLDRIDSLTSAIPFFVALLPVLRGMV